MKRKVIVRKETAIEALAKEMRAGFKGIREDLRDGFKRVDKRFELVDKRFNSLGKRLDGYIAATAEDIAAVDGKIDMLGEVVRKIDTTIEGGFSEIHRKLDSSDTRISGVEGVMLNQQPHRTRS
jgi:hypothetical protein